MMAENKQVNVSNGNEERDHKESKESKGKKKKKKVNGAEKEDCITEYDRTSEKDPDISNNTMHINRELQEINKKLEHMLTKDDRRLKEIITEAVIQMKESLLSSVERRVEVLERALFEKQMENDKLLEKVKNLETKVEEKITNKIQENKNEEIELQFKQAARLNDLEQYGRRNNIIIHGIEEESSGNDRRDEEPEITAEKVINKLNKISGVEIKTADIDMCHRLGRREGGKGRPIIVKMISRLIKNKIISKRRELRDKKIYINEDLTKLNRHVAGIIRKQLGDNGKVWTRDGKIMIRQDDERVRTVHFKEYRTWMGIDRLDFLKK